MTAAPATPWSPTQQAWLQAMGYTVLHGTALADALAAAVVLETPENRPVTAQRRPAERAPAAERPLPVAEAAAGTAAPAAAPRRAPAVHPPAVERAAPASGTRAPSVRLPDRLQIALLRASGLNPNDPATQTLMATWPLDILRGNAAAKRALWPQLRALRRRGGTA